MCCLCFDVILKTLLNSQEHRTSKEFKSDSSHSKCLSSVLSSSSCPLFVTWEKQKCNKFQLRGCIGTLNARPLLPALKDYSQTSAFRDKRFDPISTKEIPYLRVGLSLLVNYEECLDCYDWTVGIHGIIIKVNHDSIHYSATFLPEVAFDHGWDQQTTIHQLLQKSGYCGDVSPNFMNIIHCTRYQSSKQYLTYEEYVSQIGVDPLKESLSKLDMVGFNCKTILSKCDVVRTKCDTAVLNATPKSRKRSWKQCLNFFNN